jgi:hypothetical protein
MVQSRFPRKTSKPHFCAPSLINKTCSLFNAITMLLNLREQNA